MAEIKIIFTGSTGAGKTTAIAAISEIPPVRTDVAATDAVAKMKANTTVGLDFGEITLEDGQKVYLYGTPGQARFAHMWKIITQGGLGLIILVNNTVEDPFKDLALYLDNFKDFIEETAAVIGVTQADNSPKPSLDDYYDFLEKRGENHPVLFVDVRQDEDVLMILDTLLSLLEYQDIEEDY